MKGSLETSLVSRFIGDCRRILGLDVDLAFDTQAFGRSPYLSLQPSTDHAFVRIESLPHHAYIQHLAGVADFHLNAITYAFDYPAFTRQLRQTASSSLNETLSIWQTKTLAVIAVGKLFLEKGATEQGPPGIQEFLQCVASLPSAIDLMRNPMAAMEMLCLLAFYAHFVDIHIAAYLYARTPQLSLLPMKVC